VMTGAVRRPIFVISMVRKPTQLHCIANNDAGKCSITANTSLRNQHLNFQRPDAHRPTDPHSLQRTRGRQSSDRFRRNIQHRSNLSHGQQGLKRGASRVTRPVRAPRGVRLYRRSRGGSREVRVARGRLTAFTQSPRAWLSVRGCASPARDVAIGDSLGRDFPGQDTTTGAGLNLVRAARRRHRLIFTASIINWVASKRRTGIAHAPENSAREEFSRSRNRAEIAGAFGTAPPASVMPCLTLDSTLR
jgi:hypothetical protein